MHSQITVMSEDSSHISLSLLNRLIKEVVQGNFLEDTWLVAEISEIKTASSGHCYLDLVEKKNQKVMARIKANIWSYQYTRIAESFFLSTGKPLERGMKILLLASVNFHELYGVSLVVKNIDATYTLGELAKNKQAIINRLTKEGLLSVNSSLALALVPKRIAVVSSSSAAGYEDFVSQLLNNGKSYLFEHQLFQASMQGDSVEAEVLAALSSIHQSKLSFDVVVLIRGGGASLDLTAFDNYEIAKRIAQFPLPVITGIGHERDGTVVDMVAHTSLKTPTAVASFLIEQFEEFEEYTKELADSLVYLVKDRLLKQKNKTKKIRSSFALLCQGFIAQKKEENFRVRSTLKVSCLRLVTRKREMLTGLKNKGNASFKDALVKTKQDLAVSKIKLKRGARELVQKNKVLISNQGRAVKLLDPINVLSRGYAMVQRKDKTFVKSITHLKNGDELRLTLKDGSVAVKLEENYLKRKIKKK